MYIRRLIHYYRPYKLLFFADMMCALVVCAVDLAFPQVLNWMLKHVFTREVGTIMRTTVIVGVSLLVLYLVRYACQYFITCYGHIMGAKMERDMRQELFEHYQKLSFSYYDRNNTGEMMSRLVTDLFDIVELAHHGPETLLISSVKIIGSYAILLCINPGLALLLAAVTAVMTVFSYYQNKKMRTVFMDNRKKIASVSSGIQDSLAGIRVVKSFSNEKLEKEKFAGKNGDFYDSRVSSYRVMGFFHSGTALFHGLLYIAILTGGGWYISQGKLNPAELAIYALYVGIFIQPIEMLLHFTEMFQRGFTGFRRFCEIIDTAPEITDSPGAVELVSPRGSVAFKDVSFSYNKEQSVLQNINIELAPGKTVALVGPSGGGKSTICALLMRFYDTCAGKIEIDGNDIRNYTLSSLRKNIGIVQQDIYMFSGTIRENIAYGKPDATMEEIINASKRANIHDFVMSLPDGYDSQTGERGVRLSGGQKQRISIARVFLKNPPILILDEATSALDNESERKIQGALQDLAKGRTTLVIAHRLSTIRHADEIIVIDKGLVVERGTHDILINNDGIYAKYCRLQESAGE
ncbi:MAG: ABC transporter ATP-binding protein [Lentisphaerae bacterium]|nr:ABC transporter ATP-binding protein [Lentisphaerota bacterium]